MTPGRIRSDVVAERIAWIRGNPGKMDQPW
jgi:hypothetical protein